MASRTQTEATVNVMVIRSDGSNGNTANFQLFDTNGILAAQTDLDINVAASAAATALGGGATQASVKQALVQFFIACRAQARTAGGFA